VLAELATQIEQLRGRLDAEQLDAAETADLLEQITQLAQQALDEIERRAEGLETTEPSP
jgi:mRNA-degrading endonuclease toxin of MazEF toxin-antitoxin module